MQKIISISTFFLLLFIFCSTGFAQDTTYHAVIVKNKTPLTKKDSSFIKSLRPDTSFSPHKAVVRSAIIPGWGQVYNRQAWKVPIIYGALGTTAGIFLYNLSYYKKLRKAVDIRLGADTSAAAQSQIDPELQYLSTPSLQVYRNEFRQDIDYSVLFFLFFWGLNVVDATVSAHLKAFDVSDNLSFEIKPGYSPLANTNGLSFVLNLDKKHMH